MAHMIPDEAPAGGPGAASEAMVYEALRDALDDSYFVYSRLRYVEEARAAEGECDLLVLHPERGLLLIEVKGEGVRRTGTGKWQRVVADGRTEEMDEGPFEQAQRSIKELVRELNKRASTVWPGAERVPFVHGHAVAFPRVQAGRVDLPLDGPRDIVMDAGDLADAAGWVERAYDFWRRAAPRRLPKVTPRELKGFRKALLHPAVDLVPRLGGRIASDEQALVRLSKEQSDLIDGWLENRRLRVKGGAGTGKTVLAIEVTRRLVAEGAEVLLLCFNKHLGRALAEAAGAGEPDGPGRVEALHFHRLCYRAYEALGLTMDVPEDPAEQAEHWTTRAPQVLMDALDQGKLGPWDAIVVDEGQDFAADWWVALECGLRDPQHSRVLVFYDPSQDIFGRNPAVPEAPTFRLTRNFRNTRSIAKDVGLLGGVEMLPHDRCPVGSPPSLHQITSPSRQRSDVARLVERLVTKEGVEPEQIAILTPHSRPRSFLAGVEDLGGVPLSSRPTERDGAVLHATIGAFKGLESDVVIFADVDPTDARCTPHARYVAASRARHVLHVFAKGDWLEGVPAEC